MKTFKYLGKVSSEIFLEKQTIRFSQPKAFNDPFELQPEFYVEGASFIKGEELPCKFVIHGHQSSYEKYLLNDRPTETQLQKVDGKGISSKLSEHVGILCLTRAETLIPANFLMWAHYAESHQGLVIEFHPESELIQKASPVHYLPRRPIIDARMLYENEFVAIEDLYFKSDVWSYENEVRITKKLSECTNLGTKDALGNDIYVADVPLASIKCIYLGYNSSSVMKEAAIKLNKSSGISVVFLKMHDEEYKLIPYTYLGGSWAEIYSTSEQLLFNREKM